jgi:hypothetical protein
MEIKLKCAYILFILACVLMKVLLTILYLMKLDVRYTICGSYYVIHYQIPISKNWLVVRSILL